MKKSVLVSGASGGIGRAAVEELIDNGFTVYAGVLNASEASELNNIHSSINAVILDVCDEQSIASAIDFVQSDLAGEPLYGVWSNAGISCVSAFKTMRTEQIRRVIEVNLLGGLLLLHAALPLLERNRSRVVITGSATGMFAAPAVSVYTATKWALEGFTDALRIELAREGISLSLIQSGLVKTGMPDGVESSVNTLIEGMSPQEKEDFEPLVSKIAHFSATVSTTPAGTAKAVLNAFTSAKPKIRYRVGHDSKAVSVLRHFPDMIKDFIQRKIFGV